MVNQKACWANCSRSPAPREQVFIATKVHEDNAGVAIAKMENSFRRLRTNVIDLMMVHSNRATEQNLPVMQEWKQTGRFRYVGISHSNEEAQEDLAGEMLNRDLDFVQLKYSVDVRTAENRLLPTAADQGVAVMANVPLGRGSLLEQVQGQDVPEWAREGTQLRDLCTTVAEVRRFSPGGDGRHSRHHHTALHGPELHGRPRALGGRKTAGEDCGNLGELTLDHGQARWM